MHTGSGTILIMDDEEVVRETLGIMLESLGYVVVCKENGRDAIDFFIEETKTNRAFAAMIFDLTVPGGVGGKEAIIEIRKMNKEVPVFVSSGYADDAVIANPKEYGFTASICKPFKMADLAKMLGEHVKTKQ